MTNRETVIKKLQEALDDAENNGNIYTQIRRPVVFDALVLLKEQEPIAPSICGSWYLCSKCKMPIAPKERFCRRCGQAVKWE